MTWISALVAALAVVLTGCSSERNDTGTLDALVAFAREPNEESWASVPFAAEVRLGLGDRLLTIRPAPALRRPAAWELDVHSFRAGVGPFSALDVLAAHEGSFEHREGSYRRCASLPAPPPRQVSSLRRLSIQPRKVSSCLQWFAVDVFVDPSGEIRAVTLDLWEP